jgi:hypothetical protein
MFNKRAANSALLHWTPQALRRATITPVLAKLLDVFRFQSAAGLQRPRLTVKLFGDGSVSKKGVRR